MEELIEVNQITQVSSNSRKARCEIVTVCPMCKGAIRPEVLKSAIFLTNSSEEKLGLLCLCRSCCNIFVVQYSGTEGVKDIYGHIETRFKVLDFCGPIKFKEVEFEQPIQEVSPSFAVIFNQAYSAECSGLDQIAGIGYRKALEFLVKDFLISENPVQRENIEKKALGNCINDYVDDPRLKTSASRAVWLGNDQTHYQQKYTDKDLEALKKLIRASVHWVSMILETKDAESIPHPSSL